MALQLVLALLLHCRPLLTRAGVPKFWNLLPLHWHKGIALGTLTNPHPLHPHAWSQVSNWELKPETSSAAAYFAEHGIEFVPMLWGK